MAKKKARKEVNKKNPLPMEIIGLILILIGIIGIITDSLVGNFIKHFAVFLVGTGWVILLLAVTFLGFYLIAKRKYPTFFSKRLLGLYIIIFSILSACHFTYARDLEGIKIITTTIDYLMISFSNQMISFNENLGGGIIGASIVYVLKTLFGVLGLQIILGFVILVGIILLFDLNISDIFNKLLDFIKSIFLKEDEEDEEAPKKDTKLSINDGAVSKKELNINDSTIVSTSVPKEIKPAEVIQPKSVVVSSERLEQVISGNKDTQTDTLDLGAASLDINISGEYKLPPLSLLKDVSRTQSKEDKEIISTNAKALEQVLQDFSISAKVVAANVGPTITQYELELKAGIKVSRIQSINKEIALALAAKDIRIEAPIPGKRTIGIELPNNTPVMVSFKEIMARIPEKYDKSLLACGLGKDIMGKPMFLEINKTPHLLVAGATGSGKSVCINGLICSILMRAKPDEVKFIMVDPKKVELNVYNGIPHLLAPVVTDPKKASIALRSVVTEMEKRYETFSETGTRNIESYNELVEKTNEGAEFKRNKLPYIVVLVDELADLMLVAAKEVEESIMRITQMARAAGIHLVIATQRPSTDVITGVIKANIPSRIAFSVSSSIDSRTILDAMGAEKLIGKGDMLSSPFGSSNPTRIQGAFVSDEEIKNIVDFVIEQQKADYKIDFGKISIDEPSNSSSSSYGDDEEYEDPLYDEICNYAISAGKISASLIQRKYRLGYNRAARVIDLLEERGIIGPNNGSKPREVLVSNGDVANDDEY